MENFDVGYLNPDIAVESCGDQAGDDIHDVGGGLPVIRGESLHDWVEGILSLVRVDENAKEQVDHVNEDVGAQDTLPEIPGVAHLSKERDEEHSTTV